MRSERIRLFQTLPHNCGYFDDRMAQNLVIDPAAPNLDRVYDRALSQGFRRAGGHLYIPRCPGCSACTPCRIPVQSFRPNRSQRRCATRNADLRITETAPGYNEERYALYVRYLRTRHRGGGMDEADPEDFERFMKAPWSPTVFLEMRLGQHLLGVAVTDICKNGVSAVYTFFDPSVQTRGLGTFGILSQIELARRRHIPFLYLGFWIAGHPKMQYKARFHPLHIHTRDGWAPLSEVD